MWVGGVILVNINVHNIVKVYPLVFCLSYIKIHSDRNVITVVDEATPVASITWPIIFVLKCHRLKYMEL